MPGNVISIHNYERIIHVIYGGAMTEIKSLIIDYLDKARMMQVATSNNGQPWACTVYFAYDEDLNLYWISLPSRRHSLEIAQNPKVAGAIVLPHTPGDDVRGIQFEGEAAALYGEDAREGMNYYSSRYKMDAERVAKIVDDTDGHVCYKIKPRAFVLFDEVNFPDNSRQEYVL